MKSLKWCFLFLLVTLLAPAAALRADVIRGEDCLPPVDSHYVGVINQLHQMYGPGIVLKNPDHFRFANCTPPPPSVPGAMTMDMFGSLLAADVSMGG
jgi:hypothetical protein